MLYIYANEFAMFNSENNSHTHIWHYLKMTDVYEDKLEENYYKMCPLCKKVTESDEDEYLDNAFLHVEELWFSNN